MRGTTTDGLRGSVRSLPLSVDDNANPTFNSLVLARDTTDAIVRVLASRALLCQD
jgi:hypothetical protein